MSAEVLKFPGTDAPPLSAYDDELAAREEFMQSVGEPEEETPTSTGAVTAQDFHAYMPTHSYLFVPTRALWPASSVNVRCDQPVGLDGQPATKKVPRKSKGAAVTFEDVPMSPAEWLDKFRPVEQMTWAPSEAELIRDKLVDGGGWIERPGCAAFNLYRPPTQVHGDGSQAGKWISHVKMVYGEHADYLIKWLAHRVQRPGEKINHALVLGGKQGIGKDTILEPVKYAVGHWNFAEVTPTQLLGRFNGFVKSVVLRVSEARDLGDVDRYAFYEHLKIYTAAPPDVLLCDEKNLREHAVVNVTGVIITTNNKQNGIYLPADDRRHYVAWSDLDKEDIEAGYWKDMYDWYRDGGIGHVVAHLATLPLTDFDAKAPPPKTEAFWEIVSANAAPEDRDLADTIDHIAADELSRRIAEHGDTRTAEQRKVPPPPPDVLTLARIEAFAADDFRLWLRDRKNARAVQHRLETAGYVVVRAQGPKDGQWSFDGKRFAMYARDGLSVRERHLACAAYVAALEAAKAAAKRGAAR